VHPAQQRLLQRCVEAASGWDESNRAGRLWSTFCWRCVDLHARALAGMHSALQAEASTALTILSRALPNETLVGVRRRYSVP